MSDVHHTSAGSPLEQDGRNVVLCECFARDGLQHEPDFLPTATKAALVQRFADIGFARVEATSYSNPKVVPQFADASDLLRALPRRAGVYYKATCANGRAVERAVADASAGFGANEISLLVSATETHSMKNLARSRSDQWANIRQMAAVADGRFRLVGTISMAFGCSFEGHVDPATVIEDVGRMRDCGVRHVTLGDTTGTATPVTTRALFRRMMAEYPDVVPIAHFHDTRGTGLANYVAALESGVRHFDCAFGGVGGHPAKVKYGGGHTGNVCTEDLVDLFENMGISTGIDMDRLLSTVEECEGALGRPLHGRVARSGLNPLRNAGAAAVAAPRSA
ncbi:hydroxymethylglutaryl-CoA lyase [Achromobacter aloeverae]|uniref:Hydroxymethylglutaryl-CoA lyase n=1 Tax=Achromobacter aloeverae TaxID=1750518 RepID=A0A4Q1HIV1_9BURK|nr:hydroxymethylglutaryl-CoA lyase [Achromobacter aloeverae]RXN88138.1 hydroxymethylglutaryl-CoA lyase [Achromobacter aloeverae]